MQNDRMKKKDNIVLRTLGNIFFVLGLIAVGILIFWFFSLFGYKG